MKIYKWMVLGGLALALVGCGESGKSAVQAVTGNSEHAKIEKVLNEKFANGLGCVPIVASIPIYDKKQRDEALASDGAKLLKDVGLTTEGMLAGVNGKPSVPGLVPTEKGKALLRADRHQPTGLYCVASLSSQRVAKIEAVDYATSIDGIKYADVRIRIEKTPLPWVIESKSNPWSKNYLGTIDLLNKSQYIARLRVSGTDFFYTVFPRRIE
ncbi:MAG: hypothetical protein VB032_02145 [Burkholderiaceae bacterium]|nr:hypothetical protein [Burkholderiaceae bacterium]